MNVKFQCGDGAALIDYVYDEGTEDTSAVAAHIATCASCADEVRALQGTREDLRAWTPPDAVLGFQVVTAMPAPTATVLRPARWWQQPLPAWAQVAAAAVLFSAGAALGMWRGVVTAPGASPTEAAAVVTAAAPQAKPASIGDLAALEQRLRDEMTSQRGAVPASAPVATRQTNDALLEQVHELIRDSERRQQQELTLRTAELIKDVDAQRRGDLARIERTFGQMEGQTGMQVEQQRQLLNYLMRVSQRQPQ